jgi:hypothetical protein
MIHITPNLITNGCVGIPYDNEIRTRAEAEAIMEELIYYYELAKKNSHLAYIEVRN